MHLKIYYVFKKINNPDIYYIFLMNSKVSVIDRFHAKTFDKISEALNSAFAKRKSYNVIFNIDDFQSQEDRIREMLKNVKGEFTWELNEI